MNDAYPLAINLGFAGSHAAVNKFVLAVQACDTANACALCLDDMPTFWLP